MLYLCYNLFNELKFEFWLWERYLYLISNNASIRMISSEWSLWKDKKKPLDLENTKCILCEFVHIRGMLLEHKFDQHSIDIIHQYAFDECVGTSRRELKIFKEEQNVYYPYYFWCLCLKIVCINHFSPNKYIFKGQASMKAQINGQLYDFKTHIDHLLTTLLIVLGKGNVVEAFSFFKKLCWSINSIMVWFFSTSIPILPASP